MILLALLSAAVTISQACMVPPPPPVTCIRKGDPPAGFEVWDAIETGSVRWHPAALSECR